LFALELIYLEIRVVSQKGRNKFTNLRFEFMKCKDEFMNEAFKANLGSYLYNTFTQDYTNFEKNG